MLRITCVALFLFLPFTNIFPDQIIIKQIQAQSLTPNDGLPGKSVTSIAQDGDGFLWVATRTGLARYDGYTLKKFSASDDNVGLSSNHIGQLLLDDDNRLWISTLESGVNRFLNPGFEQYIKQDLGKLSAPDAKYINAIEITNNILWIGTQQGLYQYNLGTKVFSETSLPNLGVNNKKIVHSIFKLNATELLIGVNRTAYILNTMNGKYTRLTVNVENKNKIFRFRTFARAYNGQIWAGNDQGLYKLNIDESELSYVNLLPDEAPVYNLLPDEHGLWIGTLGKGLFHLDNQEYLSKIQFRDIPVNLVLSLFKDGNGQIWLGSFYQGLLRFPSSSIKLNLYSNRNIQCPGLSSINSIYTADDKSILFTSENNVFIYTPDSTLCEKFTEPTYSSTTPQKSIIKSIQYFSQNKVLINSSLGTSVFDLITKEFEDFPVEAVSENTFYVHKSTDTSYLQGTSSGLFHLSENSTPRKVGHDIDIDSPRFINFITLKNGTEILGTSKGLLKFDGKLLTYFSQDESSPKETINTIFKDDSIWVGMNSEFIYQYDMSGHLIKSHALLHNGDSIIVYNILGSEYDSEHLFISTNRGLFRFNKASSAVQQYNKSDGLLNNDFVRGAAFVSKNNLYYFGGNDGFISFAPEAFIQEDDRPNVKLTKLTRFNKEVSAKNTQNEFFITEPIEHLEVLELGHKDYVIGFEFAGLHYADPSRNQYAYKLDGFHDNWNYTDASNRTATFTNLKPGDYVFRVKAANKDGVWSTEEDNVALNIRVKPAPWFSWWAYTLYSLLFMSGLFAFIRYRTNATRLRAIELEQEVAERTHEINEQKNTIQNLLKRKDELFANISHEFRTPLTLILGPLENELKSLDSNRDPKHLLMIQRNANRLLGMVEQILKLTALKNTDFDKKQAYAVDKVLTAIVDSFQPLAEAKNIYLSLKTNTNKNVLAVQDAIEVMVGNLISNAIKYTPDGGNVTVSSTLMGDGHVCIDVTDTGIGMTPEQKQDIFDRFVRLEQSSDIPGTGIGLSIVKELVEQHAGKLLVESTPRQGTTFSLRLPITHEPTATDQYAVNAIDHLIHTQATVSTNTADPDLAYLDKNEQNIVLIIEDSPDMRDYIAHVLDTDYHCLTADRGQTGLDMAIEHVPDLIVCDVMMPGMDGYEVARKLRDHEATSHIPIVLLTAKGDKQSRIQGWNENIDAYMTKPFDESELLARVDNLISVRKMLGQQVSQELIHRSKEHTDQQNDKEPKISLNRKDQGYLDKFMQIVDENYSDPYFQKSGFVDRMYVSERQLHRKIKALTGNSPMEILREYRLKKAEQFLMDGESVTRVLELCGFNSASNFSRSFKIMFGMSPKQYQLKHKA